MSQLDRDFVKSLSFSYANIADLLDVSRQAVSRGVNNEPQNYFNAVYLSKILEQLKTHDPLRLQLAQNSISKLFPEIATEILTFMDASSGAVFDASVEGDFALITGDFIRLFNKPSQSLDQLNQIIKMRSETGGNRGEFTVIVEHTEKKRALKHQAKFWEDSEAKPIDLRACDIPLALFPTSLVRESSDGTIDIFISMPDGFKPLDADDADRIKRTLDWAYDSEKIH